MSEIYVFSKIAVGGVSILSVNAKGYLYIPVRPLLNTLGMVWSRKCSAAKTIRSLHAITLNVRLGSGGWERFDCIRAHRVEGLLWSLLPRKQQSRVILEELRDTWPKTLAAMFPNCPEIFSDAGSLLVRVTEAAGRADKETIQKLEAEIRAKEKVIADLRSGTWTPVAARYTDRVKLSKADAYVRMWELKQQGMDNAAIAREVGVSRTVVSLFLSGKYHDNESTRAAHKIIAAKRREAKKPEAVDIGEAGQGFIAAFPIVGNARGGVIHRGGNTHAAPADQ